MLYIKTILDARRPAQKDGKYPVRVRMTHNRTQKYYSTGFRMTTEEFNDVMKPVPPKRYKELRSQLEQMELKVRSVVNKLEIFSFSMFERVYFENKQANQDVYKLYEEIFEQKMEEGKIGTASNYRTSMNSLKAFKSKLSYVDVTPEFLKDYERSLLAKGKSISTVGIYLRPLRAVLNEAINRRYFSKDIYPFGNRRYVIPESRNIKKALTRDDFRKIAQYVPEEEYGFESRSKDFWLFSYLCQGMNPKDILLLKKDNVTGDYLHFIREKTKGTIRTGRTEITVPIVSEAKSIMEKWRNRDDSNPYLFGFIHPAMSPERIHATVQQFVKVTNDHLSKIAKKVGVGKKVTCYTARYQFTQTMVEANVGVEYIKQCLGHKSILTTQRYIGSFEDSKRMRIAQKYLLAYNND